MSQKETTQSLASAVRDLWNYTVFALVNEAEGNISCWCERDGRISIFGRANK